MHNQFFLTKVLQDMQGRGYYHNLTKQIASEELGEYPQGHIARK